MLLGSAILAALAGGAVGFWLGKRQTPPPARPMRNAAAAIDAALDLAPAAMRLLANPIVRTLAIRVLMRQIAQRIER
jgi:hypothetical protein